MKNDWLTSDFDFDLPPELIAQEPVSPRDAARLLHVTQRNLADCHVRDLPDLLRPNDVLVMNDTRVIPARIYGKRGVVEVEILLHRKQPQGWLVFARPGKRLHKGEDIVFAPGFAAHILDKLENGELLIRFTQDGDAIRDEDLAPFLERHGEMPLPPYIKRENGITLEDRTRYQTVYAARDGAVAAPTAGLHFTPELIGRLTEKGIECATVTLHVGAGTFLPVKADLVKDHVMHVERGEITPGTAAYLNKAHSEGRRIVAIGTTSLRLLEAAADEQGVIHPFNSETGIFITPGYRFKAVDALFTNFHLPKSTLFMLVSAFAGLERMRQSYEHAKAQGYRFYSYGDATLLEKAIVEDRG